ncbi:STAS domain-containing protein [Actinoplanes sp. NPDC051470]|uniref:STAS domain-containing protein n=1 Tax=Actinoplanes sp. NPDC051470 TaxID=3157224 RepID=UPI003449AAAC
MEDATLSAAAGDGTATVTVLGEVDFSNAGEVSDEIREAVDQFRPSVLYIDLKDASFVDSTGLGALIEGYHAAGERDCRFVVVNPNANFRRILAVTGLSELFGLTEIEGAGLGDFETTEATGA